MTEETSEISTELLLSFKAIRLAYTVTTVLLFGWLLVEWIVYHNFSDIIITVLTVQSLVIFWSREYFKKKTVTTSKN